MRRPLVLVALLLGPSAAAQPARSPAAREQANQRFEAGKRAYRLGQFDKAIEEWTAAYQLYGSAGFLYNIAKAHEQKGDLERAVFFTART
jgi:tetratricopeptide (TPR) repeat protein